MSTSSSIASSERTVAALKWVHEKVPALAGTLEDVTEIEALRDVVESFEESKTRCDERVRERISQHEQASREWERVGGGVVKQLDEMAVQEVYTLAEICAALGLSPSEAMQRTIRIARIGDMGREYMEMESEVAEKRRKLAESIQECKKGVENVLWSYEVREETSADVERRKEKGEEDRVKSVKMERKAREYERRGGEGKVKLRVGDVQKLEGDDEELKQVEKEVEEFGGLPANLNECKRILKQLEMQVAQVEDEIVQMIKGLRLS